ncbi:PREDICTED: protein YLS9 [Tarenaya hassleriana]|uniref:protein YLS9 n=1 Tax=Tarenaya hassleriana TaxID=28532 RepID=UPI00053C9999|nr:PREDICTED: protein YLS9 [Tarenaya hassleriana]
MAGEFNSGDSHRTKLSSDMNNNTSGEFPGDFQRTRTGPPAGTYLVQIPKEQIYRVPPPENAHRYDYLSRRKTRRRSLCRRCVCSFLAAVLIFAVLATIAAAVLYLVYRPEKPRFSVARVSITGFNLTSPSLTSPEIEVTFRLENPNGKLGFFYEKGSTAKIYHDGVNFGNGVTPSFKQPAKNITTLMTALKGSGIQLTASMRKELTEAQKKGTLPFSLKIDAPVKVNVGSVTTWTMSVTVDCEIAVDKLTASADVVTEKCRTGLHPW